MASREPAARRRGPSPGPAAIVIAVAVVIMVAGAALSLIGGASARGRANQLGTDVRGIPFKAVPAAGYLRHVEAPGEPPTAVVKALTVPASSVYESYSNGDGNAGQFARSVTFSVPATPATVARFYSMELRAAHWSMEFDGFAKSNRELLAQRSSSDGYDWGVAVVISPVVPTFTPALAGSSQTSTTSVTMTVYEVQSTA
ncbi:MAG: hypothetical protein M0T79_15180 [Actinomycetota bacterium]|nr:hypothetical protein [Actinomycetota bacterium]